MAIIHAVHKRCVISAKISATRNVCIVEVVKKCTLQIFCYVSYCCFWICTATMFITCVQKPVRALHCFCFTYDLYEHWETITEIRNYVPVIKFCEAWLIILLRTNSMWRRIVIRADTSLHVPIEIASKWGALQSRSPLSCCGWIQFQMSSFAKPLDRVAVAMFYFKKIVQPLDNASSKL